MFEVDKDTFEQEVLKNEGPVLVDFWSQSCEPCKALMPHVEELAEKYGESLKFVKMDTTKARRLAITQKVLGLPTIAVYLNGEKVDELTKDDAKAEAIEEMIKKHI